MQCVFETQQPRNFGAPGIPAFSGGSGHLVVLASVVGGGQGLAWGVELLFGTRVLGNQFISKQILPSCYGVSQASIRYCRTLIMYG